MEQEILGIVQSNGITGVLIVALLMGWKVGKFFAPLLENYIKQTILNQAAIVVTLGDLKELHRVSNDRMLAIETQLVFFKEMLK